MVALGDLRVLLVDDNESQHRLVPLVLARVGNNNGARDVLWTPGRFGGATGTR